MFMFCWGCYQSSKQGATFGTLHMLTQMKSLGGEDVSIHEWGTPFQVVFATREDARAARELVEEHFDTFVPPGFPAL